MSTLPGKESAGERSTVGKVPRLTPQYEGHIARRIRAWEALREFCLREGIDLAVMRGPSRLRSIAWVRQRAYYEVRNAAQVGLPILGDTFDRDQRTIAFGIEAHVERISKNDPRNPHNPSLSTG